MASTGEAQGRHSAYLAQRRFGSLDGLRALSVTGVVWHHTAAGTGILGAGWLGVHVFFILSGFLITTLLLREFASIGAVDVKAFYVRRALRIFPAYYVTVAIYALLAVTLLKGTDNATRYLELLPAFVTYTANWFYVPAPGVTLFVHGWSLSAEEQFYLLWPPLLVLALRLPRRLAAAACAVGGLLLVRAVAGASLEPSLVRTVLESIAAPLSWGALLAIALHSGRGFQVAQTMLGGRATPGLLVAAALGNLAVSGPVAVTEAALLLLVGACVVREKHGLAAVLTWKPLEYLGRISYGVYLYHLLVVFALLLLGLGGLPAPAFALVTLLVTAWIATVSYAFLEQPFLQVKERRYGQANCPVVDSGSHVANDASHG